jgi:hypothetical protein
MPMRWPAAHPASLVRPGPLGGTPLRLAEPDDQMLLARGVGRRSTSGLANVVKAQEVRFLFTKQWTVAPPVSVPGEEALGGRATRKQRWARRH